MDPAAARGEKSKKKKKPSSLVEPTAGSGNSALDHTPLDGIQLFVDDKMSQLEAKQAEVDMMFKDLLARTEEHEKRLRCLEEWQEALGQKNNGLFSFSPSTERPPMPLPERAEVDEVDRAGSASAEAQPRRSKRASNMRSSHCSVARASRGFVKGEPGDDESAHSEDWEFDEGSFSVGIIALVTKGLPSAFPQLALALVTPILQAICWAAVFEYMIRLEVAPRNTVMRILTSILCFILMGLSLTNVIIEGYTKMIFCCRCATGQYVDVCAFAGAIGTILAFLQVTMPMFIVGLSMQLVIGATSALDAFMNYVALLFITEIDAYLTSSRTIANFIDLDSCKIHVRLTDLAAARKCGQPCCWRMLIFANFVSTAQLPTMILCLQIAGNERVGDLQWWLSQLPGWIVGVVAVNIVMLFGGQWLGGAQVAFPLSILIVIMLTLQYILHIAEVIDWTLLPLHTMWLFVFGIIAIPAALGREPNPQRLLVCPVSIPLLSWLVLIGCMFWTMHFNKYHYA